MTHDWQGFYRHFGRFIFINMVLASLNLLFFSGYLLIWFVLGWGVILVLHLIHTLLGGGAQKKLLFQSDTLKAHIDMARRYKKEIEAVVKSLPSRTDQARLRPLIEKLSDWVVALIELAGSVDTLQQIELIQHDLKKVPQWLKELDARLLKEEVAATRDELEQAHNILENQWHSLRQLQNAVEQSQIKIERAAASLGTIYTRLILASHLNDYSSIERILTEVDEEIRILQDHQEALEEVKLAGQTGCTR